MRKSVSIILTALFMMAMFVVGGTLAWFTAQAEPAVNQFTAGTVDIEINEHGFVDIEGWDPGQKTVKKVSIKSTGTKCVYVRMSLNPVWGDIIEDEFVPDSNLPVDNVVLEANVGPDDEWVYVPPSSDPEAPIRGEGWYYYKHIICQGSETPILLESVTLLGASGNEYQGKTLQIVVSAEAVQASHEAYKDTWGLPALPDGVDAWEP